MAPIRFGTWLTAIAAVAAIFTGWATGSAASQDLPQSDTPPSKVLRMSLDEYMTFDSSRQGGSSNILCTEEMIYYGNCLRKRNLRQLSKLTVPRRQTVRGLRNALDSWLYSYFRCRFAIEGDGTYWSGEYYDSNVGIEQAIWSLEQSYSGRRVPGSRRRNAELAPRRKSWCRQITGLSGFQRAAKTKPPGDYASPAVKDIAACSKSCTKIEKYAARLSLRQRGLVAEALRRTVTNMQ